MTVIDGQWSGIPAGAPDPGSGAYVDKGATTISGTLSAPFVEFDNSSNQSSLHLVASPGFTGPELLGMGVNANGTKGLVADVTSPGALGIQVTIFSGDDATTNGVDLQSEAGSLGTLLAISTNGSTGLAVDLHSQGTPGAGQILSKWRSDNLAGRGGAGPELLDVYADTGLLDVQAPAVRFNGAPLSITGPWEANVAGSTAPLNVSQLTLESDATHGPQASFNWYSGTSDEWFSNRWISGNTTEIQLQCATGAAAIGSETWDTVFRATAFLGTPKLAFFNVAPVAQPSAAGSATGYAAGTTAGTFHEDDTYTGNVGTTGYTINGIVAALKDLGLVAQ